MGRKKHHRSKGNNLSLRRSKCDNLDCFNNGEKAMEEKEKGRKGEKDGRSEGDKFSRREKRGDMEEASNVPIDARSRSMRAFLRDDDSSTIWRESSEDENEEEEERVELNIRPRFVFVSSLCSICMQRSKLFCERCRMVSYCSTAHRAQGSTKHRELCEPLNEIRSSMVSMLSDKSGSARLDPEQYRVYRLKLIASLESKIGRWLELWEREIILYPRVCRSCRCFSEKSICCSRCGMEYFCEEHGEEHENWCAQFQILQRVLLFQHRYGWVDPKIPNEFRQISVTRSNLDLDHLLLEIYGNCPYYRKMDTYTYSTLSQLCTIPLTALYSAQTCCPEWETKMEWTIHLVGAEFQFEGINLRVWEKLFLHFLPNLKKLRLILIGPELRLPSGVPPRLLSTVRLCKKCTSTGRAVIVTFKPEMLYHDAAEYLAAPDLICIYNPGLYRKTGFGGKDSWYETIREFCKASVPVTVTSYTKHEILWEIARINSVADVQIVLQPRQNPFASVKPDRNFVSDDTDPLIYKNYYLTIVKGKSNLSTNEHS